jgi:Cu(I)/Ag(I) efflux system membrane fusion protein
MKPKTIIILSIVILAVIGLGYLGYTYFTKGNNSITQKQLYTCPMHPQIISDHPGTCPICGMDLVLKTDAGATDSHQRDTSILGVSLSPNQQVLANVQTTRIGTMTFAGEKVFNGYVKINQKNFRQIATPVAGKIVKQYVLFEGEYVRQGQPVFEIYSQDLYSSSKEYLLALDNYNRVKAGGNQFATQEAASLLEAARTKLSLWEMKPHQIEELETTREVKYSITVYSKYSGVVVKKYSNAGRWAMAGETIYDLADLSSVWVIANIYQSDAGLIKSGQIAEITTESYPGEIFTAKINFVYPVFDANTRTMEVRLDVGNPGYKLKPDMYVKIKINTYITQSLAVPKNAVLRTGDRNIVYIQKEKGVFVPREIGISYEQDGYYAVTYGLKEGEIVASSGGFLIDSETQIQAGMTSGHEGHTMPGEEEPKINPDQDIMKDMEQKNEHKGH